MSEAKVAVSCKNCKEEIFVNVDASSKSPRFCAYCGNAFGTDIHAFIEVQKKKYALEAKAHEYWWKLSFWPTAIVAVSELVFLVMVSKKWVWVNDPINVALGTLGVFVLTVITALLLAYGLKRHKFPELYRKQVFDGIR